MSARESLNQCRHTNRVSDETWAFWKCIDCGDWLKKDDGSPLVKGPTTFTDACTCDSQLPGYHRMDCGVYV